MAIYIYQVDLFPVIDSNIHEEFKSHMKSLFFFIIAAQRIQNGSLILCLSVRLTGAVEKVEIH